MWVWYKARCEAERESMPGWAVFTVFMIFSAMPAYLMTMLLLTVDMYELAGLFAIIAVCFTFVTLAVLFAWPIVCFFLKCIGLVWPWMAEKALAWDAFLEWRKPWPPKSRAFGKWKPTHRSEPIEDQPLGTLNDYVHQPRNND